MKLEDNSYHITNHHWSQCKDMVTITFDLCLTESEIESCDIHYDTISVKLNNGEILLQGNLEKHVIPDASKWYINNNR